MYYTMLYFLAFNCNSFNYTLFSFILWYLFNYCSLFNVTHFFILIVLSWLVRSDSSRNNAKELERTGIKLCNKILSYIPTIKCWCGSKLRKISLLCVDYFIYPWSRDTKLVSGQSENVKYIISWTIILFSRSLFTDL